MKLIIYMTALNLYNVLYNELMDISFFAYVINQVSVNPLNLHFVCSTVAASALFCIIIPAYILHAVHVHLVKKYFDYHFLR